MITNHLIESKFDITLAMIENTPVRALCGDVFTPRVRVGTSGKAMAPGAPMCRRCERAEALMDEYFDLRDERDRIQQVLDSLNAEYRAIQLGAPAASRRISESAGLEGVA